MLVCQSQTSSYFNFAEPKSANNNNNINNNNNNNNSELCERNSNAPRIISGIRKSRHFRDLHSRTRISGDLLVLLGTDHQWIPRKVVVKAGQLLLGAVHDQKSNVTSSLRIPLRQLSLQAGPLKSSFSLVRGQAILVTLQTANEKSLDLWVKTIAVELIRQTPLECIKYLDILSLTAKDCNSKKDAKNPLKEQQQQKPDEQIVEGKPIFPAYDLNDNVVCENVEVLLQKCQSNDCYVPVKEKLVLFESLCRISSCSTEDVSFKDRFSIAKRARSMHDLSYCFSSGGNVREICKYFETKLEEENKPCNRRMKRLVNSDSSLHRVVFNRNLENVSYA